MYFLFLVMPTTQISVIPTVSGGTNVMGGQTGKGWPIWFAHNCRYYLFILHIIDGLKPRLKSIFRQIWLYYLKTPLIKRMRVLIVALYFKELSFKFVWLFSINVCNIIKELVSNLKCPHFKDIKISLLYWYWTYQSF